MGRGNREVFGVSKILAKTFTSLVLTSSGILYRVSQSNFQHLRANSDENLSKYLDVSFLDNHRMLSVLSHVSKFGNCTIFLSCEHTIST